MAYLTRSPDMTCNIRGLITLISHLGTLDMFSRFPIDKPEAKSQFKVQAQNPQKSNPKKGKGKLASWLSLKFYGASPHPAPPDNG